MQRRVPEVVRDTRGRSLRAVFDENLRRFGAPVILRRAVVSERCECWQRLNKKADIGCPFCMGTGHPIQERIEYAVAEPASNVQAASLLSVGGNAGPMYVPFTKFLMESASQPHTNDQIIEIDYLDDSFYRRVIDEFTLFGRSRFLEGAFKDASSAAPALVTGNVNIINHVTPRAVGQRIIFWEAHTKLKSQA